MEMQGSNLLPSVWGHAQKVLFKARPLLLRLQNTIAPFIIVTSGLPTEQPTTVLDMNQQDIYQVLNVLPTMCF